MPPSKPSARTPRTNMSVRKAHRGHRTANRVSRDPLATYRKKRDFAVTSEPSPEVLHRKKASAESALEFVVQKHDAKRLHYDHRIEIDGAMMSWAVPKGPSYDPAVKRLAVETEDHPMAYNEFEGRIPDGEYGAGDVLVWDRGTYETVPPGQEKAMREKGHIHLRFHGEKLKGEWHFVRTHRPATKTATKNTWLMFKAKDGTEDPSFDVVTARPESVVSGRKATRGPHRVGASASGKNSDALLHEMGEVEKATLVKEIERPENYRFEIKYDGYRVLAAKAGTDVRLASRKGLDWTDSFSIVSDAIRQLPLREAVFDGEVCAVDEHGTPSFNRLQNYLGRGATEPTSRLTYAIFDLLWLDGRDLRDRPLEERRELLEPLIKGGAEWTRAKGKGKGIGARGPLSLSAQVETDGHDVKQLLKVACEQGLEGLIAKRKGSKYVGGRGRDWLKIKCSKRQELAILGYVPLTHTTNRVGALLVGFVDDDRKMRFAGKVGTGFDTKTRQDLAERLDAARIERPDVAGAPRIQNAHWSKPKLVAEVGFTEWTPDRKIRHPSFLGLRADKKPSECTRELPVTVTAPKSRTGKRSRGKVTTKTKAKTTKSADAPPADGPSNPQKVLFPESGITKQDVYDYLGAIAEVMIPHMKSRPIALQRWPNGIDGKAWFQQRAPEKHPDFAHTVDVGDRAHLVIDNRETLLWLGNLAALTVHQWSSHAPTLDRPDYVVFDLDPGKGTWAHLIEVAERLHGLLDELALDSIVKTSGKRGLHVVVPLAPGPSHEDVLAFAATIATTIADGLPEIATVERSIDRRGGRLYVDYLQNGRGKTIVAPYTIRALPGAPVSTPIAWDEVTAKLDPSKLTIRTVLDRVEKGGDLWRPALQGKGKLPRLS
jgi:bifunctional non-homologous end joining protein LigD